MRRIARNVERRRQTADTAGDEHGVQNIFIHIDSRKLRRKAVCSHRPELIALRRLVEQERDEKRQRDRDQDSHIYVRFQKRVAQKIIFQEELLARLRSLPVAEDHRVAGLVDRVRSDRVRLVEALQAADVV